MPRNASKPSVKSKYSNLGAIGNANISHFALHETGSNVGVTSVTRGSPTIIGAASTSTLRARQWVKIVNIGGATGVNGIRKILWTTATEIAVDYDSSAESAYTSGGSVNPTCIADTFGNMDGLEMSSAASVLWSTTGQLNFDATNGTSLANIQTNTGHCDIAASDEIFIVAVRASIAANPTGQEETILTYGVNTASQVNSKYGTIKVSVNTSGGMQTSIRRAGSEDNSVTSNQSISCSGGALSATKETFMWALIPSLGASIWYRNGSLQNADAITLNGSGWPSAESIGWIIGAQIVTPGNIGTIICGKGGSTIAIDRLLFGKITQGTDKLALLAKQFHTYGGFPKMLVGL